MGQSHPGQFDDAIQQVGEWNDHKRYTGPVEQVCCRESMRQFVDDVISKKEQNGKMPEI